MQMEALQYQRMMEEQSEFDQEALQLLNELMVKREKENAELEKELEVCRKRLEEYETKEKIEMIMRRMKDDSSVDSDENTPVSVVLRLDECLDDYEGERLSLLERLEFLEEKLTALHDEEDEIDGEMENGNHYENGVNESESGEIVTVEEEVDELYERIEALKGTKAFDLIRVRENEDVVEFLSFEFSLCMWLHEQNKSYRNSEVSA
ncbi:hypothetical protein F2Q70_00015865 [Brassica cretica]|uniref:GTD-binding domain-containing protein n=1 Tax=Brassica cretica TaxID=69181 RepID=A0A8S9HZD3_BRACR|nr:hypothetical protein F2Q70_00015865 [Brassica cretica]